MNTDTDSENTSTSSENTESGDPAGANLRHRLFCWEIAQGVQHHSGFCGPCRYRQVKYLTTDTSISLQILSAKVNARKSGGNSEIKWKGWHGKV